MKKTSAIILSIILILLIPIECMGANINRENIYTKEELEYIKENPVLMAYVNPDKGYLSLHNNNVYQGIEVDVIRDIAKIAGFELKITHNFSEQNRDQIDIFSNVDSVKNFYDEVYYSDAYLESNNYIIKKKNKSVSDIRSVALLHEDLKGEECVKKELNIDKIHYYNSNRECMETVISGNADAAYCCGYIARYYLKNSDFSMLDMEVAQNDVEFKMCVPKSKSPILISIVNKTLAQIDEERIHDIVLSNSSNIEVEKSFSQLVKENKITVILVTLGMGVFVITLAITAFKKEQLRQELEKAKLATRAKSDFLSRMSHDIRTPLNAIIGFTQIAKESENLTAEVKDNLEKIDTSSQYLLGIINDILDMSKIESGKLELNYEAADCVAFHNDIAVLFSEVAKKKNIKLKTDFSGIKTKWVMMDTLRSRQIYANLLNNAIKFSDEGTCITWTINDIKVDEECTTRVITIKDEGCGMSPEFMRTMFDPFAQEHNKYHNPESGTGLGLAIVKNLIDLSGNKITVDSEIGKGTQFTITLVRKNASPVEKTNGTVTSGDIQKLKDKRILLFEDHPLNRQIMKTLLEKKGIQIDCAVNGKEGVDIFEASEAGYYSAVFMDISMPVMNGYEATIAMRNLNREDAKTIPVIAITANAFNDDVEKCMKAGMNYHIAKPIDINKVYEILDIIFENSGE